MSSELKTCVLTGSSGYVGSCLKSLFLSRGWSVRELRRDQAVPFLLGQDLPLDLLKGSDVFIHCAYDFKASGWEEIHRVNVEGSVKLFEAARQAEVRRSFFISSVSAYKGCESLYGRAKLEVEDRTAALNVTAVRLGLIYGPSLRGIFGNLSRVVQGFPWVPLIGGGLQRMVLLHECDMAEFVFGLCEKGHVDVPQVVTLAHPTPVLFRDLLKTLSEYHRKSIRFISVPFSMVLIGLKGLEGFGLKPRLRSDSLISLVKPNPCIDFEPQSRLGFQPRSFTVEALKEHH